MKRILLCLLVGIAGVANAEAPKNVIMVVGDGMGPAFTTAYRYFADDPNTEEVEETVFDRLLVGTSRTNPHISSGYITDSAAGATALSTGVKTYNGAIAVDVNKKPLLTVLEYAKQKGMKTGVAVTSQINHATPASYASHNEKRRNYNEIADSYFDQKVNDEFVLDVMLGGGWDYFIREDRDLTKEFVQAGYQYIDEISQLDQLTPNKPTLGLFDKSGLAAALDFDNKQRLPLLTKAAVKQLENQNGFFLLVEASQVDWAGHANDIALAMAEMGDMAATLEYLEAYVVDNPDTLLVVTADHSTGGLSVGGGTDYRWGSDILHDVTAAPITIAAELAKVKEHAARQTLLEKRLGFALTEKEAATFLATDIERDALFKTIKELIDERTNTHWAGGAHSGVDVQVFATGKGASMFKGAMNNTDIGKKIFTLLGRP